MQPVEKMLLENRAWAQEKTFYDPGYFGRLLNVQTPDVLWIGCSDSRVPAETIVNAQPGEMFVHRNIANQILSSDLNSQSVIEYAVEVLAVKHIIVCGHYNCGGIKAAMDQTTDNLFLVSQWLTDFKSVIENSDEISLLASSYEKRLKRCVELNVIQQVKHLTNTDLIQRKWRDHKKPSLHGWVYGLEDGLIKELIRRDPYST